MTIASISLSITSPWPATAAAPVAKPARAAANDCAVAPAQNCGHAEREGPRRSPLYSALMDALGALTAGQPATTTTAPAGTQKAAVTSAATAPAASAAEAPPKTGEATVPPPDLAAALADFARALMQALRGDDGERHGRHHGHHHHHHDHGRRAWGDPAQRIEQLGARLSPPAPVDTSTTTPTPAVASAPTPPAADTTPGTLPATAPAPTPAGGTVLNLTINIAPAQGWLRHGSESLIEAFGNLQQALGRTTSPAEPLESQLATFLRALAVQLRQGEEAPTPGLATQPGALLNVSA